LPGEDVVKIGARNAQSEEDNFSYRNVHLALLNGNVAGMMLAYRLPSADAIEDPNSYPEFIRPFIELEQCVPESFYINMLASYPEYRNRGVGTALMENVDSLARGAGCTMSCAEVFEENCGALRFYQRLGYHVIEKRPVIEHRCHQNHGRILLLVREVAWKSTDAI